MHVLNISNVYIQTILLFCILLYQTSSTTFSFYPTLRVTSLVTFLVLIVVISCPDESLGLFYLLITNDFYAIATGVVIIALGQLLLMVALGLTIPALLISTSSSYKLTHFLPNMVCDSMAIFLPCRSYSREIGGLFFVGEVCW